jgi:hypothetical protein
MAKPGVSYNIGGVRSAVDCVERCYLKWLDEPTRKTKATLRGAVKNLSVWAEEMRLAANKEMGR